jgi:hypothetical protein
MRLPFNERISRLHAISTPARSISRRFTRARRTRYRTSRDRSSALPQQTQAFLRGAETKAADAGPKADHRAIFVRAVIDQKPWFDSFVVT